MDMQVYARNMEQYFELNNIPDSAYETRDDLIRHLIYVATEKRKILVSNNEIINELIVPYENGTKVPTDEELEELYSFFKSLFVNGVFYDRGTCERIIHIMYNTYINAGEYNKAVRQLHLIYYFDVINNLHQALGKVTYTQQLADVWEDHFDKLDDEGKLSYITFLLAAVYDENDKRNALKRIDRAVKYIDMVGADINDCSNGQFFGAYRSALTDLLGHVCDALDEDINAYSPEEMKRIDEYRQQFLKEKSAGNLDTLPISTDATIKRLEYHFGECTQKELLDWLLEYAEKKGAEADSKSLVDALGAEANFFLTIQYNFSGTKEEKEALWNRALEVIRTSFSYTEKTKDDFYVFDSSAQLVQIIASQIGFEKARNYVFDITVFHDKALSIHTVMVSRISRIILEELLNSNPEYLQGVCGCTTEFIKNNHDVMMRLMWDCALFHDIGKHYCLDYIQNAYRNLTDREFDMIKCHPEDFAKFFPESKNDSEEMKCIRECAVMHHTWHDGTKGYPIKEHSYNRPFVDILSIADSIDAATDSIGRPYNKGKSLDSLIEEFAGFGDTRYSSTIVELLRKPDVKRKIEKLIDEGRKDITYAAYTDKLTI